jgi:IS5 family transposase
MTQGRINIIDATPVEAAQSGPGNGVDGESKRDPEASWHVKKNSRRIKMSSYRFSIHTGVDEDGFIHRQGVTAGDVHDSQERDSLLLRGEVALYADAAYCSQETQGKLDPFGINDQVQRKGYRNTPLSCAGQIRNQIIAVTRSGAERPFATDKQHDSLARTRFMGLAKNTTVYGLAAIAANIRTGAKFLMLYGLPDPCHAG